MGCGASPAPDPAGSGAALTGTAPADCLNAVWKAQATPNKAFDRAHDQADGGSISCATGTSASAFAATLAAIRAAAASGDKAKLAAQVGLPLLYIDSARKRRKLDRDQLASDAAEVFSPAVLALLRRIDLGDLAVVPHEGAFADLGAVWLVAGRTGGQPRIVTIDRQALAEAAKNHS